MRLVPPFMAIAASVTLVLPAAAQDVTLGVFSTVEPTNVVDFEEATREHQNWHRDQNDPQVWAVYQAFTGIAAEYVTVAAGMPWAQFDDPPVDMMADQAHWNETGARYSTAEDVQLWSQLTEMSTPLPNDMAADYPVIRVLEFEIRPGGDGAFMNGLRAFKEAMDAQAPNVYFAWTRVVSADRGPSAFIAVWAPNFAALGAPAATPLERLSDQFGAEGANAISSAFSAATSTTADRIWVFRPDLSYLPGM